MRYEVRVSGTRGAALVQMPDQSEIAAMAAEIRQANDGAFRKSIQVNRYNNGRAMPGYVEHSTGPLQGQVNWRMF